MNPYKPVRTRSYEANAGTYNASADYPGLQQQQQLATFLPEGQYSSYLPAEPAKSGAAGILSNLNLNQIKGIIDKMGGIEGVLATVSKVQKMMQTVQQFGPLLKMLIPKKSKAGDDEDYDDDYPRKRKRRRKRRRYYKAGRRPVRSSYYTRRPVHPYRRSHSKKRRRRRNW